MEEKPREKRKLLRNTLLAIFLPIFSFISLCIFSICVDDGFFNLPSIPSDMWSHVLLQSRSQGVCETLTGDVLFTVIFVDDENSSWTDEDMAGTKEALKEAISIFTEEAVDYGAELNISVNYMQATISEGASMEENVTWADSVLSNAGLPPVEEVSLAWEEQYEVKEAPVIFCVNSRGRSFAAQQDSFEGIEFVVIYEGTTEAFRHELSHLFGAKDYYYPDVVKDIAGEYFPDSIMLMEEEEKITDSLTAYLIGWKDEVTEKDLEFLRKTAHISAEEFEEDRQKEVYTGYGTRVFDFGTYTGDLVEGACEGTGRMVWNDGTIYDGQWMYNSFWGQGTCYYTDGSVYIGEWVDGMKHGQGTLTYPDGSVYSGTWEEDQFIH